MITPSSYALESAEAQQPPSKISITGVVKDAHGDALIGVNVIQRGSKIGTVTNAEGRYSLSVEKDVTLTFSYLGYISQSLKVGSSPSLDITLLEDAQTLDEVVVVGFGNQKKVNLTGAVSSVAADVFENKPVLNVGQALQGVLPNLNVNVKTGSPNEVPSFNIRGGTSMSYDGGWNIDNGSPLILVDGIEAGATHFNMMNPNDIESISVLKDASASAIYGARASFGVMLITTKSGKNNQKAQVNYNYDVQWSGPTHLPDILDSYTQQYAQHQSALMTDGTISPWDNTVLAAKKKYMENPSSEKAWIYDEGSTEKFTWIANINPYDLMVKDWSPTQKHAVNVSGGSEKIRYYVSLGYQDQDGMYKINTDNMKRYNGLMSLDADLSSWFSLGAKMSHSASNFNQSYMNAQKGSIWSAMKNEPWRNINQPIKSSPTDPIPNAWTDNIVGWAEYGATENSRRSSTVFNLLPTIKVSSDLKIKGEFSYKPSSYSYKRVIPEREYLNGNWTSLVKTHTDPSSIYKNEEKYNLYTINAYADYSKTIAKKHNIGMVAGFNQEWYTYNTINATRQGILINDIPVLGLTTGNQYAGDSEGHWAVRGGFGRLNYNFNERYLLEFSGRYDGTSKFPKDDRFKFFPSFSLGWRASEEAFMAPTRSWLDNLKFRGSWGSIGNQNVSNYAYHAMFGSANLVSYMMGNYRPIGITAPGLVSPNLTWETAKTLNGGVDITTLQNRLDLSFDIYQRKTVDILMEGDKYPAVLGVGSPRVNSGELQTNGWELSLKWRDKLSSGLRYDIAFVLSDYQTKVNSFAGNPRKLLSSLYDGMKMGQIWGYETVGILQESDFTKDANGKYVLIGPSQTKLANVWYPGDIRYRDIGGEKDENGNSIGPDGEISVGDGTVANPGDRKIIGNSTPRLRYGLTGNVAYKGFDFNIFFQGVAKRDVWISDDSFWGGSNAGNWYMYNNSWTPENTGAKYPMYASRGQNRQAQTGYLFNAAYLRLKILALGYTLPSNMLAKTGLSKVRFNVSGYNLLDITDVPDVFDPDLLSASYPVMKSVSFGVQIGF
ncbi:SusC/RagA family TonB-linked outer membrane protein [Bacteroidales bacterium]|nr:SusC/RagA family TonB-linked outer membrane protein [Bacteroidales bacterium]